MGGEDGIPSYMASFVGIFVRYEPSEIGLHSCTGGGRSAAFVAASASFARCSEGCEGAIRTMCVRFTARPPPPKGPGLRIPRIAAVC